MMLTFFAIAIFGSLICSCDGLSISGANSKLSVARKVTFKSFPSSLQAISSIYDDSPNSRVPSPLLPKYQKYRISSQINSILDIFSRRSRYLRQLLTGNGWGDKLLTKETLAKLGLNALLAYGFVSNFSYITCLVIAWFIFMKSSGVSPLAQGQWKNFLVVYAGFWAINNILRPLRFTASIAITPLFDKLIAYIEFRMGWSRRKSTAAVVFLVNVCGTVTYMLVGVTAASYLAKHKLF